MGKKKKNTASRPKQCARDEAAQLEDDERARVVAAATDAYSQPPPAPVSPPFISEDPLGESKLLRRCAHSVSVTASVCVLDVQARGERAITQCVPEILPADPVVTNIRGSI